MECARELRLFSFGCYLCCAHYAGLDVNWTAQQDTSWHLCGDNDIPGDRLWHLCGANIISLFQPMATGPSNNKDEA